MPNIDGRGPFGQGPKTGLGLGPCGRGLRRGLGRARDWGLRFGRRLSLKEEKEMLSQEEEALKQELEAVKEEKRRIEQEAPEAKKAE